MNVTTSIHIAATAVSFAIIWIAQIMLYPQFRNVPRNAFEKFHQDHMRRIAFLVGPALLVEGVSATVLLASDIGRSPSSIIAYSLLVMTTLMTFRFFAPLHTRLQEQYDLATIERLISFNRARVTLQTLRLVFVLAIPNVPRP